MTLWKSYTSLSPRTRALFGIGLIGWATVGLWTTPQVEGMLGMVPSESEQEELERRMAVRVESVDSSSSSSSSSSTGGGGGGSSLGGS